MVKTQINYMKKYIPTREYVENHKWLRFLTRHIEGKHYLWEFNRATVTRATLIGVFWAIMPMPFQMVPAAIFAVLFRANILVAIAWVWISNPITMVPILYSAYYLGCLVMGTNFSAERINIDFHSLLTNWHLILFPLLIGSIILGVILAITFAIVVWVCYTIFSKRRS